jgi:hypothetical protein
MALNPRFALEINRAAVLAAAIMSIQTELASRAFPAQLDQDFLRLDDLLLDRSANALRRMSVPFRLLSALCQRSKEEKKLGIFYDGSFKAPAAEPYELNEIEAYREDHARYWASEFEKVNKPLLEHIRTVLEPQQAIFPRYVSWPNEAGRPDQDRPSTTQEARYLVQQPFALMNVATLHLAPSGEKGQQKSVYSLFGVVPMRNGNAISSLVKGVLYNQFYSYRADALLVPRGAPRIPLPMPRTSITRNRIYIPLIIHRMASARDGKGLAIRFIGSLCLENTLEGIHATEHKEGRTEYASYGRTSAAVRFSIVGYGFSGANPSDHVLLEMAEHFPDPLASAARYDEAFLGVFGVSLITTKPLGLPLDDEYDETQELILAGVDRFFDSLAGLNLSDGGEYWLQYSVYVFAETWVKTIKKDDNLPAFVEQCAQNHMRTDGSIFYAARMLTRTAEANDEDKRRLAAATTPERTSSPIDVF